MGSEVAHELKQIEKEALAAIAAAAASADVEEARVAYLGRRSRLAQVNRDLAGIEDATRRSLGHLVNEVRGSIEGAIAARLAELVGAEMADRLETERIDVTLPGRAPVRGAIHPLTTVIDDIVDVFVGLGFKVAEGPIVETDYYNFEVLNIPKDHAARSMHDTLYVESSTPESILVKTHTSPMQARLMQSQSPPIYVVIPGRCARRDETDSNHLSSFMQIEGLAVDEGISFSDMKGTLEVFAKAMFGPQQRVRMHPSYFPFTEPSAEVYVSCFVCDGSGCPTCRGEGWIEIMGAGMVHPNVLGAVGYDAERYTGFAFGMGVERIAKLRYGVHDLRTFYENDLRFLAAFR